MSTKMLRLRFGAAATVLLTAGALLLAPAASSQSVSAATPAPPNEQVCGGLDSGKVDVDDPPSVTYTAPDGYLVSGYCVKAGSVHQGLGPKYFDIDPPQKTVTITYPGKNSISHYSVALVPEEVPTTTEPEPTTTEPEPTTTEPEPTTTEPEPTTTEPEPTTTTPEQPTTEPGATVPETPTTAPAPTEPVTTPPSTGSTGGSSGSSGSSAPGPTLAPPLGQLAETGTETVAIMVIAGALLLVGGLAVLAGRRVSTR